MLYKKKKLIIIKTRKINLDFRRILYKKESDDYLYDFPVCSKQCILDTFFTCSRLRKEYCEKFNQSNSNHKYVV